MRDAFGGIFMIRLLLVFIVIYVAFAAISLNYAKAFRIKNKVISYIEENDIQDFESLFKEGSTTKLTKLGNTLNSVNYNIECKNEGLLDREDELEPKRYCYHGIIIEELENSKYNDEENQNIIRYKISTFVNWNLNFMNRILMLAGQNPNATDVINGSWEINGEAKVVKRIEPEQPKEESDETI